jgi:dihydroxyacetone kinase-like protein
MIPACEALKAAEGSELTEALKSACAAAEEGAKRTVGMQATKGRARFLKEKSIGFRDAGASSFTLYLEALRDAVSTAERE